MLDYYSEGYKSMDNSMGIPNWINTLCFYTISSDPNFSTKASTPGDLPLL